MSGFAPLSPPVVESWSRLTHQYPNAMEFEALVLIDAVLCAPVDLDTKDEAKGADEAPKTERAWPIRRPETANG